MLIEAVIFDFDGVIADTMHDNFRAWEKVFLEYNVQISSNDYFLMEGMGRFQIAEFFADKYGLDKNLAKIYVDKKEEYYKQNNSFRIYDEIPAILELLQSKGIKMGLVSGAGRERIERTLQLEIRKYFDIIVSSDDVKNGKPHPEPYLKALDKTKSNPANTVVVENARLGIQSAKAAGCYCFAVETTLGKEFLTGADIIFDDHTAILNYLKNHYEHTKHQGAIQK